MGLVWVKKIETEGSAVLFPNYLITNKEFLKKFDEKYSALVGVDADAHQVVLKPLSYDEDNSPQYEEALKLKISIQKSYIRFGNTKSMKLVASLLNLNIPKEGIKGKSKWDDKQDALFITLGGNN